MNAKDIKQLFEQAKQGDNDAFGTIYESYFTQIFRYMYYRVKDKELAEDLVQTVFIKVFARIDDIDNAYPKSYFFTVARNTLTDYWRKKKDETFDQTDSTVMNTFAEQPVIEHTVNDSLDVDRILHILESLPEDQQDVIRLKFIHDLTNAEIAAAMRTSSMNVRQLQCRALRSIRKHLS